ncbi:hypothetical protein NLG97_g6263 [Lecanicillium saksenae]|uniref:Uncharacterized protein n=1 Tax=Lecanicillium saksenae TaxID=468837 RepID=A0ACC1QQ90_9HYPO|nr:hypothetical protein NLG97_g6263 [Lecanicillium saksenae]
MKLSLHLGTLLCAALAWSSSAAAVGDNEALDKRAPTYYCGSGNVPSSGDCDTLYNNILSGATFANLETADPRSLRHQGCFVSWSDNVVGNARDLLPYIRTLKDECVKKKKQSGIVKDVHLQDQAKGTAICVSNRGTNCHN